MRVNRPSQDQKCRSRCTHMYTLGCPCCNVLSVLDAWLFAHAKGGYGSSTRCCPGPSLFGWVWVSGGKRLGVWCQGFVLLCDVLWCSLCLYVYAHMHTMCCSCNEAMNLCNVDLDISGMTAFLPICSSFKKYIWIIFFRKAWTGTVVAN